MTDRADRFDLLLESIEKGFCFRPHEVAFKRPKVDKVSLDVQKISRSHTERYGQFGICMKFDWALKAGADRVVYVDPSRELSKSFRLAG